MSRKILAFGSIAILSLSLVGCSKEKLDVNFDSYYIESETKDRIKECIEVNVNANEISNNTLNQILDGIGNKNMDTEVVVNNIQGVQIAKVTEKDSKATMDINEKYKSGKKYDVEFKNLDTMKESVNTSRGYITQALLECINDEMNKYNRPNSTIRPTKDIDSDYLKGLAEAFGGTEDLDLSELTTKSKDFMDDEHVKEAVELLLLTQKDHKDMIKYGKAYKENKLDRDLEGFKGSLLEFRAHIATYQMQVSSLDE